MVTTITEQEHLSTDNLDLMLAVLPHPIRDALARAGNTDSLIEVVLDLGRPPEAPYTLTAVVLGRCSAYSRGPPARREPRWTVHSRQSSGNRAHASSDLRDEKSTRGDRWPHLPGGPRDLRNRRHNSRLCRVRQKHFANGQARGRENDSAARGRGFLLMI